jgi:two-component system, response regulator PdtaR
MGLGQGILNRGHDTLPPTGSSYPLRCDPSRPLYDFERTNTLASRYLPTLRLPQEAGAHSMRILIVEDEALIAMILVDVLEAGGHEVMGPATTATEALALCEVVVPELALLDVNLRDGSNGVVLAHALSDRWGMLVIFASGQVMEARQAKDIALGHIRKPYQPETVLRSVEVARVVMNGGSPVTVPAGFELFRAAH